MSLEAALAAHTEALNANTTAILAHNDLLAGLKSAKSETPAKGATAPKEEKPAAKEEKPKSEPKTEKPKKAKPPTEEALKNTFVAYMNGDHVPEDDRLEQKPERLDFVQSILAEFGVKRVSEIAEDDRARAIALVEEKIATGKANLAADPADDLV